MAETIFISLNDASSIAGITKKQLETYVKSGKEMT